MDPIEKRTYWDAVYQRRGPEGVSWYQPEARLSLELIRRAVPPPTPAIIDVGGGASPLVDGLLRAGYTRVTVLDLSSAALEAARRRLGSSADDVVWREADVLTSESPAASIDVWHDRAVFHFLTNTTDQRRYLARLRHALRPGGHAIIATFAEDGPTRCSGLDVARYSPEGLRMAFGPDFHQVETAREIHRTPSGASQAFTFSLFRFSETTDGH